jgi:hypothetical protein
MLHSVDLGWQWHWCNITILCSGLFWTRESPRASLFTDLLNRARLVLPCLCLSGLARAAFLFATKSMLHFVARFVFVRACAYVFCLFYRLQVVWSLLAIAFLPSLRFLEICNFCFAPPGNAGNH